MYELIEKPRSSKAVAPRSSSQVLDPYVPQFRVRIQQERAVERLRAQFRKEPSRLGNFLSDAATEMTIALSSVPALGVLVVSTSVGFAPGVALGAALGSMVATVGARALSLAHSESRLNRVLQPQRDLIATELVSWLNTRYGLRFKPSEFYAGELIDADEDQQLAYVVDDMLKGDGSYRDGWRFQNDRGVELRANIVAKADGVYELHKVSILDTDESIHITPLTVREIISFGRY